MKQTTTLAALTLGFAGFGSAQTIGSFDFIGPDQDSNGNLITDPSKSQSLLPTHTDECIELSAIRPVDNKYSGNIRSWSTNTYDRSLTSRPTSAGGLGLSENHANCFSGWSSSYDKNRLIEFDVTFGKETSGSLDTLDFSIGNYGYGNDPSNFIISVLRDGEQIYQSGSNAISYRWTDYVLNFDEKVSEDKRSSKVGESTTFTVQLGAFGTGVNSFGAIALDDIDLFGKVDCTHIPEPSSALLALTGLFLVSRRRR